MKRLEEALDFLQRQEDKLWFWGVERAEDMGFSAEFLREAGMRLDRRNEFPKRATSVTLAPEREVPASVLDRKSVVEGKSVDLGGRRIIKKKKKEMMVEVAVSVLET